MMRMNNEINILHLFIYHFIRLGKRETTTLRVTTNPNWQAPKAKNHGNTGMFSTWFCARLKILKMSISLIVAMDAMVH